MSFRGSALRAVTSCAALAFALAAGVLQVACSYESAPHVAEVELLGELTSNTCGAGGFDADESFDETGDLYGYAGDDASFRWSDADDSIAGTSTAKGVYTFTATSTSVAITDATGAATCTVERRTKLTLTVTPPPTAPADGGVADGGDASSGDVAYTITGTLTDDLYTASGSNCAALRGENGGAYDTFPCRVAYDVEGGSL